MKVLVTLTLAVLILLFQAAVLMFAWAAVANTFDWPAMGLGAAIASLITLRILTYHLVPQKTPVVQTTPQTTQSRIDALLRDLERKQGING